MLGTDERTLIVENYPHEKPTTPSDPMQRRLARRFSPSWEPAATRSHRQTWTRALRRRLDGPLS